MLVKGNRVRIGYSPKVWIIAEINESTATLIRPELGEVDVQENVELDTLIKHDDIIESV